MRKEDFFEVLGELDDDIVKGAKTPLNKNTNNKNRKPGWPKWGAVAAVMALMVCSFSVGAAAFAKEIVIEVPVEQERIQIEELGLTLILPDDWKGKYALERSDNGEYHVYNPMIRKAMGGNSEMPLSGGMLFYILRWEDQLTKAQVDEGGEWSYAKCEYVMTTKDGTYLLYYSSDLQFTQETMREYEQMESEITNIRFIVDNALAG